MVGVRPQRGAASGGQQRSVGAAESSTARMAISDCARAQPSGSWRSRSIGRGASPPADRRSCVRSCGACSEMAGSCAAHAATRDGRIAFCFHSVVYVQLSDHVRMATAYETNDMCTCDVFVSFRDFVIE